MLKEKWKAKGFLAYHAGGEWDCGGEGLRRGDGLTAGKSSSFYEAPALYGFVFTNTIQAHKMGLGGGGGVTAGVTVFRGALGMKASKQQLSSESNYTCRGGS
eukprot:1138733-Pelagomonas_calceolata.AAC.2